MAGLENSNLRGNLTGLRQRQIFLFRLLGEERILLVPGGPKAGDATGTYSRRPSYTTSKIRNPGLTAVSLRGVPMCYHRSEYFGSATVQDDPISTGTQTTHNLACACCP